MPLDQPLTDNGIIFRWHKHPLLIIAMSSWWEQLNKFSKRDQISFPYVVWKNKIPVKIWDWSIREKNDYFEIYLHRQSLVRDLMTTIRVCRNDNWWSAIPYKLVKRAKSTINGSLR